jgi:hypothetical protein
MDLLTDSGHPLPQQYDDLDFLTPFAVEFRYDLFASETDAPLDRQAARGLLNELRIWVEAKL